jgi:hypothetical protein
MAKQIVQIRISYHIEVPTLRNGRPSYKWVQGYTYSTPRGGEVVPDTYKNIYHLCKQDYPNAVITRALG